MSLFDYAGMLFRSRRIEAFREAIEARVDPGRRVLDLGCGLGTYAFMAARAGAGRVTAVDADRVIHVARALAVENDLSGRIDFVRATAPDGLPGGGYDLVVFEDYPTTFLDARTWRLLEAVQSRHLSPGGVLLPGGVRFTLAPVVGDGWAAGAWLPPEAERAFGLRWAGLRERLANTGRKVHLPPGALAAEGIPGPRRELVPLPTVAELAVDAEWTAPGEAVVGMALWFDLEVMDGVWVSNRPADQGEPWGQWLLPVDPPLMVPEGVAMRGRVWREASEDGAPGFMRWSCEAAGARRRGHDFAGLPIGSEDLTSGGRRAPS